MLTCFFVKWNLFFESIPGVISTLELVSVFVSMQKFMYLATLFKYTGFKKSFYHSPSKEAFFKVGDVFSLLDELALVRL